MGVDEQSNPTRSCQVLVTPSNARFSVARDETLMDAALRQGYSWPTACGGCGECGLCRVRVMEGIDELSSPDAHERRALRLFCGIDADEHPEVRLACQALVSGNVTVHKVGVRR